MRKETIFHLGENEMGSVLKFFLSRQALNEAKKQNHGLMERLQAAQTELGDSEVRRSEVEGQIRQSHTVSPQSVYLCYT